MVVDSGFFNYSSKYNLLGIPGGGDQWQLMPLRSQKLLFIPHKDIPMFDSNKVRSFESGGKFVSNSHKGVGLEF